MSDPVSLSGPVVTSPIVMGGEAPPPVDSPVVEGMGAATLPDDGSGDPENTGNGSAPADSSSGNGNTPDGTPGAKPDGARTTPEWAQKRINELTGKRHEAERVAAAERARALAAEQRAADLLQQLAGRAPAASSAPAPDGNAPANGAKPTVTDEEIERRVVERAAQMAAANRFNEACNNVAEAGKKEFAATWDESLKNLSLVGAVGQNTSPEFLETAIELKQPHKILHYLGKNLEEAERIVKLPPTKMAMEMARLEALLNAPAAPPPPAAISSAPAPVIPVAGAAKPGLPDLSDPNLPMEDYVRIRAQQREAHKLRYAR
jgi:hypothetical protein